MYEKYRKIIKTDKFPELPKGIKPRYISKIENRTFVFGEDKEKRYTFVWDRISEYYTEVYQNYKAVT